MKNNQTAMGTLGTDLLSKNQTAPAMESSPPGQMNSVKMPKSVPTVQHPKAAMGKPVMKKKIRSIQDLKDAAEASKANYNVGRQGGKTNRNDVAAKPKTSTANHKLGRQDGTTAGGLGEEGND